MFDCELVGKIGSMALIRRDEYDIDYNFYINECNKIIDKIEIKEEQLSLF
jgi:hypothetical protein